VRDGHRPPGGADQQVLARWSGWGALPEVFDARRDDWGWARRELAELLDERELAAAARSTLNAHYTSAEVVSEVWRAVVGLGFTGGRVLEPGCGSGNFLSLRPELTGPCAAPVSFVGVELDPTAAAICAALHPGADIRAESFAVTRGRPGCFDLAIGNVPFAKLALADPVHNPHRHSIHDHFIVKALHLTRPGGLVALITSRWTLDSRNPAARRDMAALGDLVGALRFPAGAFAAAAGTDVICDLVVLRRRPDGVAPAGEGWSTLREVVVAGGDVHINEYFARRPERILGDLGVGRGVYGAGEPTVTATGRPLAAELRDAVDEIVGDARAAGLTFAADTRRPPDDLPAPVPAAGEAHLSEGSLLSSPTGGFARLRGGVFEPVEASPKSQRGELRALIELRDATAATLAAQAASADDTAFVFAQHRLNRLYDDYMARFGPLNRFKLVRSGRVGPGGEETYRRVYPPMGGFRADPDVRMVLALENFDPDTEVATKAAIFSERIVGPRRPPLGASSATEALAICLDQTGTVDLARVADLLGVEPAQARAELAESVWEDPTTAELLPAGRYLSGDVRAKLAAAESVAATDSRFSGNVTALRAVLPADLGPAEIDARLGAPWIDPPDIAAFVREVLGAEGVIVERSETAAIWAVQVPTWQRSTVKMTATWGTRRLDAVHLLAASLEQRAASVYDNLDDGRRVLNLEETLAAREKQEAIEVRFARWIWEDPERATRLAGRYNQLFNSTVLASYDGSHLSLPGLAENFEPRPHQRDAVWRIISEPGVLLGHAVGAGKTAVMVMAGMELRRLGLVKRPAYVVPNHMLEQFANEFAQLYPAAKVLVATNNDTTAAARESFVARCATGDWDAVIVTHSAFERIPVSAPSEQAYIDAEIARFRAAVAASGAGAGLTVKRLEAAVARLEERHRRLVARERHDDGVSFEATGIDYLFCDFSSHPGGVLLVGSGTRMSVWDTPFPAGCTPHLRREHKDPDVSGQPPCAARHSSRRAALVPRARCGLRRCSRPG
jgi:N12 class adenine-specific DNA methylase